MARPAPTHRELSSGKLVRAAPWFNAGDRPEGPAEYDMITLRPRQKPLVQRFTVYLLPYSIRRGDLDNTPHSRANLILRNHCELAMREHGWLPYESGEPGVGYLLCPGDWVIIYEDGRSRAEDPARFAERYQPL